MKSDYKELDSPFTDAQKAKLERQAVRYQEVTYDRPAEIKLQCYDLRQDLWEQREGLKEFNTVDTKAVIAKLEHLSEGFKELQKLIADQEAGHSKQLQDSNHYRYLGVHLHYVSVLVAAMAAETNPEELFHALMDSTDDEGNTTLSFLQCLSIADTKNSVFAKLMSGEMERASRLAKVPDAKSRLDEAVEDLKEEEVYPDTSLPYAAIAAKEEYDKALAAKEAYDKAKEEEV